MMMGEFQRIMSTCPNCQEPFMWPRWWSEHDQDDDYPWEVNLLCANCGVEVHDMFSQFEVDVFDGFLNTSLDKIHDSYVNLHKHNQSEERLAKGFKLGGGSNDSSSNTGGM